jgi:hypothetical protein
MAQVATWLRHLSRSPPSPAPPSRSAKLGALFSASPALATDRLNERVEIIAAIVIGDLVPRLDVLDGTDLDDVFDEVNFGVGAAGMIDVARPISAAGAINGPAVVDLKKIAIVDFVGLFGT